MTTAHRLALLRSALVGALGALPLLAALAIPALAAQPANQACLGEDIRAYAQAEDLHPLGKSFVAEIAKGGGVGMTIQLHQAGLIPDEVVENSCNDEPLE